MLKRLRGLLSDWSLAVGWFFYNLAEKLDPEDMVELAEAGLEDYAEGLARIDAGEKEEFVPATEDEYRQLLKIRGAREFCEHCGAMMQHTPTCRVTAFEVGELRVDG